MQPVADPYRVLAVSRDATIADIRAAHRRLAKRYHPDAPHADAVRFAVRSGLMTATRDASDGGNRQRRRSRSTPW